MNKNILPVILIFTVTGCASSKAVGTIKEASAKNVEYCDYIANVSGTSGWGGLAASSGIENAKEQNKKRLIPEPHISYGKILMVVTRLAFQPTRISAKQNKPLTTVLNTPLRLSRRFFLPLLYN